jgi:hypothetical protein
MVLTATTLQLFRLPAGYCCSLCCTLLTTVEIYKLSKMAGTGCGLTASWLLLFITFFCLLVVPLRAFARKLSLSNDRGCHAHWAGTGCPDASKYGSQSNFDPHTVSIRPNPQVLDLYSLSIISRIMTLHDDCHASDFE